MSPPHSPALRQLHCLDRTSSEFPDRLSDVLYGEEYQKCGPNLQGDDPAWLVDYLDEALGGLDPSSPASRKCLLELRSTCGTRGILPTSYTHLSFPLHLGPEPFASGGYGDVYKGTLNGSRVCVKRVRTYTRDGPQKATKTFCQEAVLWKRLTHPNILPLLGITISPFQLISDWMSGGDLPEYITKNPNVDRLGLLSDATEGLCYLHSCNVVHGDLKGPNILVDNTGRVRIADFGLAAVTRGLDSVPSTSFQHGFTPRWTAPEVLNGGKCSKEADIFSFAMVMIEVFTGGIPFIGDPSVTALLAIVQGKRPPRPEHPAFTEELWALVQCCWDQEPHLRPGVPGVLEVIRSLSVSRPFLRQLRHLDKSLSDFPDQFSNVLYGEEYKQCVANLQGDDLIWLVDYLDEALGEFDPSGPTFRKCLRELRSLCGARGILPTSYILSSHPLNINRHPFASGGFSDVYHGVLDGSRVCIKRVRVYYRDGPGKATKAFCQEAVVWKRLTHPNILPLLGVTVDPPQLISSWMSGGDLQEYIRKNTDADRPVLVSGVASGLCYLHSCNVIHGNIQGSNILVDNSGHVRIAGFGLAMVTQNLGSTPCASRQVHISRWTAPEILTAEGAHNKETDIFSFAMVIIEVFTSALPFTDEQSSVAALAIVQGRRPPRPTHPTFTEDLWTLTRRCWDQDPHLRPEASEVLGFLLTPPSGVGRVAETDSCGQPNDTANDPSPSVLLSDNELPVPPQGILRRMTITASGPPITHRKSSPPFPLQRGSSDEGRVGRVVHDAWKTFKSIAKKIPGH